MRLYYIEIGEVVTDRFDEIKENKNKENTSAFWDIEGAMAVNKCEQELNHKLWNQSFHITLLYLLPEQSDKVLVPFYTKLLN